MTKYYLVEEGILVKCPDGDVDYIWEDGQWKNEFDSKDEDFATRYEDYRQNTDLYSNPKLIKLISEDEAKTLFPMAFINSAVATEAYTPIHYVGRYPIAPMVTFKTYGKVARVATCPVYGKSVSTVARQPATQQHFCQFTFTLPRTVYRRAQ